MSWTQFWVQVPDGVDPLRRRQFMKRVDEHMQQHGAVCHVPEPDGLPVPEADGTFEVRVLFGPASIIKRILTDHYHLTVVREQVNEDD